MNKYDQVIQLLFEKMPILKWLDGYKRTIGDVLIVLTAALAALQEVRPDLEWVTGAVAICGLLVKLCGELHAAVKERDEVPSGN